MGIQITNKRDFPSDPVHKTSLSNAGNMGSIPAWGAKIQYALWPKNQNKTKQKKNRSNILTDSIKTLKMVHIKKSKKSKQLISISIQ